MSEMIALSLTASLNFVASVLVEVWRVLQGSTVANVMSQSTGPAAYTTQRRAKPAVSAISMVGTLNTRASTFANMT